VLDARAEETSNEAFCAYQANAPTDEESIHVPQRCASMKRRCGGRMGNRTPAKPDRCEGHTEDVHKADENNQRIPAGNDRIFMKPTANTGTQ